MNIKVIGKVENENGVFKIVLDEEYRKGLIAMKGFSHILVVWWADQVDTTEYRGNMILNKPYKPGPEEVGVFATRSPARPNPICISVVSVKSMDIGAGIIESYFIDAEVGTGILDIKPYFPCSDIVRDVSVPDWAAILPDCIEDSGQFDWESFFNF